MTNNYWKINGFIIFAFAMLISLRAYADDSPMGDTYVQRVPSVMQLEYQFEVQLNTRQEPYGQPKATSYYDDLTDHVEQGQLMRDWISEGIS